MLLEDKLRALCRLLDPLFFTPADEFRQKVWDVHPELETEAHILLGQLIATNRVQACGDHSYSASYRLIETPGA